MLLKKTRIANYFSDLYEKDNLDFSFLMIYYAVLKNWNLHAINGLGSGTVL